MHEDFIRFRLIDEEEIVLEEAALSLGLLDRSDAHRTTHHTLLNAMEARLATVGRRVETSAERGDALVLEFGDGFGFASDAETHDNAANADPICVLDRPCVLDRRCGLRSA